MKKTMLAAGTLALAASVAFAVWNANTYPKIGELTLQVASTLEAKSYGLNKKQITSDGITYTVFEGGKADGEPIIMLHGYSADKNVFIRFAKHFTGNYRVIIPDLPGHGETGFKPEWAYDVPTQAARVIKLMDTLGIQKAHITGNSMGGFITATMAANYPDRLLSAAPMDPAGVKSPQPSNMDKLLAEGKNPFFVNSREDFDTFYPMTMSQAPLLPGMVLDAMAKEYQDRRSELETVFKGFAMKNMLDEKLGSIKGPFLLIWGKEDQLLHVSATDVWKAGVPQAQVVVMDGVGHMPMVEVPEKTAEVYAKFLKGL